MKSILVLMWSVLSFTYAQAGDCTREQLNRGCHQKVWHHCYPMDGCTDIQMGCQCPAPKPAGEIGINETSREDGPIDVQSQVIEFSLSAEAFNSCPHGGDRICCDTIGQRCQCCGGGPQ